MALLPFASDPNAASPSPTSCSHENIQKQVSLYLSSYVHQNHTLLRGFHVGNPSEQYIHTLVYTECVSCISFPLFILLGLFYKFFVVFYCTVLELLPLHFTVVVPVHSCVGQIKV